MFGQGIKFWCYNAGHVLGAAMFMIEIAGIKILYTGDYSRREDRHLMSAETPEMKPDVLIVEATYGYAVERKQNPSLCCMRAQCPDTGADSSSRAAVHRWQHLAPSPIVCRCCARHRPAQRPRSHTGVRTGSRSRAVAHSGWAPSASAVVLAVAVS